MSSLKALFGSGGGGGVPIGMYVWGNPALPDIVVDGTASYIKTGVVVSSVSYPLAPSIAIAAFQRYVAAPSLPATVGFTDTPFVLTNGSAVLALPMFAIATSYRISADGGDTFSTAALPVASSQVVDALFAAGFYFLLIQDSAFTLSIWRSATGAEGSWAQIYSLARSSNDPALSIAYGAGQMVLAYNQADINGYQLRISSNPTAAAASVVFSAPVSTPWSNQTVYGYMRIRYGKVGAGPTPSADVFFGMGFQGVYNTPTPATSASWQLVQYTGGVTRSLGNSLSSQVVGQGSNWLAVGQANAWISNASLLTPISAYSGVFNQSLYVGNGYAMAHTSANPNQAIIVNLTTGVVTNTLAGATGVISTGGLVLPNGTAKVWNSGGGARVSVPAGNYTGSPSQIRDDTMTITNQQPYTTQAPVAFMRIA